MNVTPQPLPAQPTPSAQVRKSQHSPNKGPRDNGDFDSGPTSTVTPTSTTATETTDAVETNGTGDSSTETQTVTFADVLAALMTNVVQTQTDPNATANAEGAVISLTDPSTTPTTTVSPALPLEALQVMGVNTATTETPAIAALLVNAATTPTAAPIDQSSELATPLMPSADAATDAPNATAPAASAPAQQTTSSLADLIENENVGVTVAQATTTAQVAAAPAQAQSERIANLPASANPRAVEATADNIHAGKKSAPVSGPTTSTPVVETATNVSAVTTATSDTPAVDTTPQTTFGPATMAPLDRTITIRDPRVPGQLPRAASDFAQQLVGQLTPLRTAGAGTYTMTLQLRPEGLGSVNVDVRLKDGTIDLNFRVQAPETRELVRMSIGDLRSQLDQAGVNSGHVDVGDMAREFGRQQNHATSDTNANLNDLFADEDSDSSITPAAVQGRTATSTTDRAVNVHL